MTAVHPIAPRDASPASPIETQRTLSSELPEPSAYTMGGLSGIMAQVHGLLLQSRDQGTRDGFSDVAEHRLERAEQEARVAKAIEDAKKEREKSSFWECLGDVLDLGVIAATAVATVASLGTSAPVLLGVTASLFSEVESKTQFLEELGVAHDSSEAAVLGANLLSLGMMASGSVANIAAHSLDYRVYVAEGLAFTGALEQKTHFIEHAGGSAPVGMSIGLAAEMTGALMALGHLSGGAGGVLEDVAQGIAGGSQVASGASGLAKADRERKADLHEASAERARGGRSREQRLEERAVQDLKGALGEWDRAIRALLSAIREVSHASDVSLVHG